MPTFQVMMERLLEPRQPVLTFHPPLGTATTAVTATPPPPLAATAVCLSTTCSWDEFVLCDITRISYTRIVVRVCIDDSSRKEKKK